MQNVINKSNMLLKDVNTTVNTSKNLWIFNHYAVPMEYYPHGRVHWFAKYLYSKGYTITIFAASSVHNSNMNLIEDRCPYRCVIRDGIRYVYIKASSYTGNGKQRIKNMLQYTKGLFMIHKKFKKPNYILAMSVHPLTCFAGICLAHKYKIPCVIDIADLWPESLKVYGILKNNSLLLNLLYRGEKWIYKHANAIVFTMEGGADYIRDRGWSKQISQNKIFNINNGIDLKEFDYNADHFQIDDDDLNDNTKFKVVYTGSIRRANDLRTIVDVAKLTLINNQTDVTFLIYGDGDEKDFLADYCKEHQIDNIKFKGNFEKKYIPYILKKADVNIWHFINNDILKYGGSPNKLFEYLASGKPILSTNSINYNLVERYKAGIANKIGTPENIYRSLMHLKDLTLNERNTLGQNARYAAAKYDFAVLTQQLDDILTKKV